MLQGIVTNPGLSTGSPGFSWSIELNESSGNDFQHAHEDESAHKRNGPFFALYGHVNSGRTTKHEERRQKKSEEWILHDFSPELNCQGYGIEHALNVRANIIARFIEFVQCRVWDGAGTFVSSYK